MDNLSVEQLEALIDSWIKSERNRRLVKRRLLDGIRFEPLSEEFELSVRQVKNIVYKSEEILFSYL